MFLKLKDPKGLRELQDITKNVDPEKFKVVGSYLYSSQYHDIDIYTYDFYTASKIELETEKKYPNLQVSITLLTKEKFDTLEDWLTFRNIRFSLYNWKYKFSKSFIDSDILEFDDMSFLRYHNYNTIKEEIKKLEKRGFKIERK